MSAINPYSAPTEPGSTFDRLPRTAYIALHLAMIAAVVILLYPLLGRIVGPGTEYDGIPVANLPLIAEIHRAAATYWFLFIFFVFLGDVAAYVLLRFTRPRPLRRVWFLVASIMIPLAAVGFWFLLWPVVQQGM